jgi:tetratricopeptide (TPR) repeat protein
MGECPDNEVFARFVEQRLDSAETQAFEAHIDGCGDCRRVLALMGLDQASSKAQETASDEPLATETLATETLATETLVPGTRLGRYVVLRRLGRGGLGVVYGAYDPELDRAVAVKLLRRGAALGPDKNERLRREARAMAKVTHPNVVAVHDVGVFEGCTFIAMEQVLGTNLRAWLGEPRSVRAILLLFREAAAGLCAVHDAGLVHRDFKPDNVLVGDDGRVRVSDFGLATGTPLYMAPEQHEGGPVDARADQYAFCVSLWEALYGSTPSGKPPPRRRGVPARIRALLARGLASDPDKRFPSMRLLARELEGAPRWRLIAAAGVTAMLAAGALWPRGQPACAEGRAQLEGVWDAARAEAVRRAFVETKTPYAADTFALTQEALDRFSDDWTAARTAACKLALSPEDRAHAMAPLRSACLDELKQNLEALVGVLAEADKKTVEKAITLVTELPAVSICENDSALLRRVVAPSRPEQRVEVARLRATIARSEALREAGRHDDALKTAEALEADVTRIDYAPLTAEWLLARAAALQAKVSGARTAKALVEALRAAEAARHDRVAAEAWLRYTRYLAWQGNALERAEAAAALTDGAIARMGGDARLEEGLALISAFVLMARGKLTQALDDLRALEARQRERLGDSAPALVATLEERWRAALVLGRYREAQEAAERAMAIGGQSYAAAHPRMGDLLHMRGAAELRLGRLDQAESHLKESLRVLEAAFGSEHTRIDFPLSDLARLYSLRGEHEKAVRFAERAVAIDEKTFSANAPPTAFARIALAEVLLRSGDTGGARSQALHSAAVFRAALGADHFLVIDAEALAAVVASDVTVLERAHRYFKEHGGPPERRAQVAFALAQAHSRPDLAQEAERLFSELGPSWHEDRERVAEWRKGR